MERAVEYRAKGAWKFNAPMNREVRDEESMESGEKGSGVRAAQQASFY